MTSKIFYGDEDDFLISEGTFEYFKELIRFKNDNIRLYEKWKEETSNDR